MEDAHERTFRTADNVVRRAEAGHCMTALVHYEAARLALAEAVKFDDVLAIKNTAEQAALYARQANDNELIQKATEIKVRAERRAGEMLIASKEAGDMIDRGRPKNGTPRVPFSLDDIGVTKKQSSRWQQLAAMPEDAFDAAVETAKEQAGQVSSAYMLRQAKAIESLAEPEPQRAAAIEDPSIKPSKQAKSAPEPEDDGLPDAAELAAELHAENERLHDQIAAVRADDPAAEALKWRKQCQVLEQRMADYMTRFAAVQKELDDANRFIDQIRKEVGKTRKADVLAAIRARLAA